MPPDPLPTQTSNRLPAGLRPVAALSADGRTLRVARGAEDLVLRWVDDPAVLRAEWATLARVRHAVVPAPLEWGAAADGRTYVLRSYVPGETLDRALKGASPERAACWIDDLLAGLDALHGAGLVHRDVKAANVIVDGERAVLLDLELVRAADSGGDVAGTLYHLAPEVLTGGRHGPRADLFSLGVTLALAYLGTPSTSFRRRFPSTSFWDAARLDPERLPAGLAALIRALVMRRPQERPSSAAAAREFLPGGTVRRSPSLELPPLAGRAELLQGWMRGAGATFDLLVVGVPDPEELEPVAEELRLAAAFEGRRTVPLRAAHEADLQALTRSRVGGPDWVVTQGAPFAPGAVSEVVFSSLEGPSSGGVGTLVLSLELAGRVRKRITPGLSETEARRVRWENLPRVELATVTAHLERLSEGSSPRAAGALARDLLQRTGGRQSDLDLLLANAVEAEVLRPVRGGYALLRESWPAEPGGARENRLSELPTWCAELLLAMGCVPGAGAERLAQVAGVDADDLGAALAGLREAGALATGGDARGRAMPAGGGWVEAAERALPISTRVALVRRARRALEESGAEVGALASIDLRAAATEEEFAAVLESAELVRRAGRLAESRQLALGTLARAERGSRPTACRDAATLLARLDIGQSDAAAARARLEG
ncbi:MAG: protein kinase, partial [Planctomycetota bacterium]